MLRHFARHRAEEKATHAGHALASHHDEVRAALLGEPDHGLRRVARLGDGLDLDVSLSEGAQGAFEDLLGLGAMIGPPVPGGQACCAPGSPTWW